MRGALVMAYGTPASREDIGSYYTHIRRGRPPTEDELADLIRRYDAIGGISPLAERTEAQRAAIAAALGDGWIVELGQKHAPPFIEDGVGRLLERGVERIVGVVLAPHYSAGSVGQYHARALAAAEGTPYAGIAHWYDLGAFVAHQGWATRTALQRCPEGTHVVFTAHSLPKRVLLDDPYPQQLQTGAAAIATDAGLGGNWSIAWQSAGRTPEPWQGPDLLTVIDGLAGRVPGVVVVPHGFTSDHLEVRYDLDIEAAGRARDRGLAWGRAEVVNADETVMAALAGRIAELAGA